MAPTSAEGFLQWDSTFDQREVTPRRTQPDPLPGQASDSWSARKTGSNGSSPGASGAQRWRALFPKCTFSDTGGFNVIGDFLETINSGRADSRLLPLSAAHGEGTPSLSGFLVPEGFETSFIGPVLENSIVLPRADVHPMKSETLNISSFVADDNSSSTPFGFATQWAGESESLTEQTGTIRRIKLTARKLATFTKSSNELLEDAQLFEKQLTTVLQKALTWELDDRFLNGSGAGEPKGVLNDAALITVAKETGQAATTIEYRNLTKMLARLHPALLNGSVWVASQTAIPELLELSIPIGTAGAHIAAMMEKDGGFSILTRPVIFTEKLATLGTVGDILLANFSQYAVGMRRGVVIESSMHVGFQTDETGWRGILRADGQGKWETAFTPKTGDTQSWCVALATRA